MPLRAQWNAYVHSVTSGTTARLCSAQSGDANFGAAVDANQADFESTHEHVEDEITVSGTGWKVWDVDPDNLDFSGMAYFRLQDGAESEEAVRLFAIRSADYTGTNYDPYLYVWFVDVGDGQRASWGAGT
jgi:hypothetical protein